MPRENVLFVSYCHADRRLVQELRQYLQPLEHLNPVWIDDQIPAGDDFKQQIAAAIEGASAALLLVTQRFVNSDFIRKYELPLLRAAHRERNLRLIPIALQTSQYERLELGSVQWANDPDRALDKFKSGARRAALIDLAQRISEALLGTDRSIYRLPPKSMAASLHRQVAAERRPESNLPARRPLIGRSAERKKIRGLLADPAVSAVVIRGIGGIGKTALTLAVAHELFDEATRRRRGSSTTRRLHKFIWISAEQHEWDPGRPLSVSQLIAAIARGLHSYVPQLSNDEMRVEVDKLLANTPTLIVIDGLVVAPDPATQDYLAALPGGSKAILPTHDRLPIGFRTIQLKPLAQKDARAFVRAIAQDTFEAIPAALVRDVSDATGGMPLAIEWVIGQMAEGMPLADALSSLQGDDGPVFERVFSVSWKLLSADAKVVMLGMPLFAAPAPLAALEFVSQLQRHRLLVALAQLVKLSLIVASTPTEDAAQRRYAIHVVTRQFAERMSVDDVAGQRQAQQRFVAYYLDFSRTHNDWSSDTMLSDLEQERVNIFKAMDLCREARRSVDFVAFHRAIYNMLWARGYWRENIARGSVAIEMASQVQDVESEAWIKLESVGWTLFCQGQYDLAREYYLAAERLFQNIGGQGGLARVKNYLGRLEAAENRLAMARTLLMEGLQFEADGLTRGFLLNALGDIEAAEGRFEPALTWYEKARHLLEERGDRIRLCGAICRMADVARQTNNLAGARNLYQESLRLSKRVKRLEVSARCQLGLAIVERQSGNLPIALQLARDAQMSFVQLGAQGDCEKAASLISEIEVDPRAREA